MQRRDFLHNTSLVALMGSSLLKQSEQAAAQDAPSQNAPSQNAAAQDAAANILSLDGAPVVGHTTAHSSTISWAINGFSTAWVEYGQTAELGLKAENNGDGLQPYEALAHQIPLTGLKPATRYYYRAHTRAIKFKDAYHIYPGATLVSEIGSFTTLDPQATSTQFIVWNDTHDQKETLTALHALSSQIPHDFLFHNGDVSNSIDSEKQLVKLFLNPYGLPFAQNAPLLFARGNHDVRGRAARQLPRFVSVPDHRFYYSFRQGPLAALVLDTGEDKSDAHREYGSLASFAAYRTYQRLWLEQEIEKPQFKEAPFRVLFCHIPLWWNVNNSGACRDGREKWHDFLTKAKIHAVISGHTHKSQVLPPGAEHSYHQIVGGGPKPESATLIHIQADQRQLSILTKNLSGEIVSRVEIKA